MSSQSTESTLSYSDEMESYKAFFPDEDLNSYKSLYPRCMLDSQEMHNLKTKVVMLHNANLTLRLELEKVKKELGEL